MTRTEQFMQRCLELSKLGLSTSAPNPSVGCVVVCDDKIIGEGFTSAYGGNHAEVNAIESVQDKSLLARSTVYVSLEPCSHHGKTPPCSDLLIRSGVKKVVIGCKDPFTEVNGAGIQCLKEAGVDVEVGILEKECLESHKRFITFHEKKRPYVILKWAETADGFVDRLRGADEEALKITANTSSTLVHKWRSEEQAILVGRNTAILDNPSLTVRKYEGRNPVRILLDTNSETPRSANIFNTEAETLVFTDQAKNLDIVLAELHTRNISSVMVEGGPAIHQSFYDSSNWDEIRRFVSKASIEEGIPAIHINQEPIETANIGTDKLYIYRNR